MIYWEFFLLSIVSFNFSGKSYINFNNSESDSNSDSFNNILKFSNVSIMNLYRRVWIASVQKLEELDVFFGGKNRTFFHDFIEDILRPQIEELVELLGRVQRRLSAARDVGGQSVLDGEDVSAHLFDAVLVDLPNVDDRVHEDVGDEVRDALEDVNHLFVLDRVGQGFFNLKKIGIQPDHFLIGIGRVLAAVEDGTGRAAS